MTMNLYVIYDTLAKESGPVFEAKNHDVAIRNVNRELREKITNPEEFILLHVGTIDHESNRLVSTDEPDHVMV